jgi:ABC-type transporter Mla subunit MlaD
MSELKDLILKGELTECLASIKEAHADMTDQTAKVAAAAAAIKNAAHDLEVASEALAAGHKKVRTALDAADSAVAKAADTKPAA